MDGARWPHWPSKGAMRRLARRPGKTQPSCQTTAHSALETDVHISQASGRRSNIGSEIFLGVVLLIVGSVTSMIVGTAIAIAMSGSGMPADPKRYLMSHPWPGLAVGMGIEALIGFGGYRWIVRKSEKRNPHELGGPSALKEFLQGAGVGIAFICLVMLTLSGFGVYTASGISANSGILLGLMLGLGAAFLEEPVFR